MTAQFDIDLNYWIDFVTKRNGSKRCEIGSRRIRRVKQVLVYLSIVMKDVDVSDLPKLS